MSAPARCDFSDLLVRECAHCQGHKLDADLEAYVRAQLVCSCGLKESSGIATSCRCGPRG